MGANACGTPAVCFDVPGLRDAVSNEYSGYLAKDIDEFVNKIELILKDKELREKMEKNAYEWSKKFDWDDSANESLRVIEGWQN